MPKKPLTPGEVLAKVAKNDEELDRLHKKLEYRLKRREVLKRWLGMACTPELNLGLQEAGND